MSLSCTPSLSGWTVGVGGRRVEFGHSGIDGDGSPSSSSDEGHSDAGELRLGETIRSRIKKGESNENEGKIICFAFTGT